MFRSRNCLIQCLESKVTPVLADIITSLDTNRNLDIVTNSFKEWKGQLWRHLLNLDGIIPSNLTAQKEFTVKTIARNGNAFSATMPFSWIIFYQIDEILKNIISSEKDEGRAIQYDSFGSLQKGISFTISIEWNNIIITLNEMN